MRQTVREHSLHTVCESAQCPNIGECWSRGTATFMILGDICTRACGFCAVTTGRPLAADPAEPARVADAIRRMGLKYVVITSVDRDDLPDGGASIWAETILRVREANPGIRVEALVPDLTGSALDTVIAARPDVLAHNLETVPRLYPRVRPKSVYARSLSVLAEIVRSGLSAKTSIMIGIGEDPPEIRGVLEDVASCRVERMTIGQYLRPSLDHLPVHRWVHPDEFVRWKSEAEQLGVPRVVSGPMVRSSYKAEML